MSIYAYSTFDREKNGDWKLIKIDYQKKDYGPKLVDDSKYRPNQPILKQVNGSCSECLNFDFPDGKIDNELGHQMAFLRQRGLTAVEFNNYLKSLEKLNAAQKEALKEELKDTIIDKLKDKALQNLAKDPESQSSNYSNSSNSSNPSAGKA